MASEAAGTDVVSKTRHAPPTRPVGDTVVDVGIPTLGNSPYLAETIESVFAQTLRSWTLTISENGPGLESVRETLEPYLRDPRVRHLVTGEKVGVGTNHNILIQAGSAPYVGLIHDDDRWHPEFLERRVRFLDEHETCGFVYSGHVVIDEAGNAVGRTRLQLPPGVHASASILPPLYRNNFIGCPTVLVRRTAYELGGGYEDIVNYDYPMWLRLAANFDVGCLEVWDADYRQHAMQTSARRTRLAAERFPVLEAVADLPISRSQRRLVLTEAHVLCALDALERGERRQSVEHLRSALRADPVSFMRPAIAARVLVAVGALAGGARARRALADARSRRWHSGGAKGLQPGDWPAPGPPPSAS
jgi:glycosyltransferase involved in cell wall biosynthesis